MGHLHWSDRVFQQAYQSLTFGMSATNGCRSVSKVHVQCTRVQPVQCSLQPARSNPPTSARDAKRLFSRASRKPNLTWSSDLICFHDYPNLKCSSPSERTGEILVSVGIPTSNVWAKMSDVGFTVHRQAKGWPSSIPFFFCCEPSHNGCNGSNFDIRCPATPWAQQHTFAADDAFRKV